jgi:hypothetical protein
MEDLEWWEVSFVLPARDFWLVIRRSERGISISHARTQRENTQPITSECGYSHVMSASPRASSAPSHCIDKHAAKGSPKTDAGVLTPSMQTCSHVPCRIGSILQPFLPSPSLQLLRQPMRRCESTALDHKMSQSGKSAAIKLRGLIVQPTTTVIVSVQLLRKQVGRLTTSAMWR